MRAGLLAVCVILSIINVHQAAAFLPGSAMCTLKPIGTGSIAGTIKFVATEAEGTVVSFNITGFEEGTVYYMRATSVGDIYNSSTIGTCDGSVTSTTISFVTSIGEPRHVSTVPNTAFWLFGGDSSLIGRTVILTQENKCDGVSGTELSAEAACVVGVANGAPNYAHANPSSNPISAYAKLIGTTGQYGDNRGVNGSCYFSVIENDLMLAYFTINGLAPHTTHAVHIHKFGDMSVSDATSAGLHFDPTIDWHGAPTAEHHHGGDMGNITTDAFGSATIQRVFNIMSFTRTNYSILGHAVIVHTLRDDGNPEHLWNSTGAAGGRQAMGVIGISTRDAPTITETSESSTNWRLIMVYVSIAVVAALILGFVGYCLCCKSRPRPTGYADI